jgi:Na+-transporting methylmalonyl-CoA/oxaloacetate decarboxylase gamma subunit
MIKIKWFIVLFIVLVVVIWIGNNKITQWKNEKEIEIQSAKNRKEKRDKSKRAIIQMASKYNAITNWQDLLGSKKVYSYEVEKAIKPKDGRPILIIGRVRDIINKNDLLFMSGYFNLKGIKYSFSLECNQNQVNQIIEHKSDLGSSYAVIARIISVTKQDYYNKDELVNGFLVDGQCVDFIYLQGGYMFPLKYYLENELKNIE